MTTEPTVPQSLQELLPKWAHFCLYVEKFISHELKVDLEGKHLLVAFSGGVDSTALLMVLHYLTVRNNAQVTAAHLNHGLRPEAGADATWVASLCSSLGIKCVVETADIQSIAASQRLGLEEAGRNARYAFLETVRNDISADYVAVGHHLDDLSEDVLMRFIRGTGWPGLSGMTGYAPERHLIRPFLLLPKSTLRAFVTHLGITWREDNTNHESTVTRNRIRNELLPLILRENPNFLDSVGRLWKIGRLENEYWAELTATGEDELKNDLLQESHPAVRLRLYKSCLDNLGTGQALAHTLFKLDEAWQEKGLGPPSNFQETK